MRTPFDSPCSSHKSLLLTMRSSPSYPIHPYSEYGVQSQESPDAKVDRESKAIDRIRDPILRNLFKTHPLEMSDDITRHGIRRLMERYEQKENNSVKVVEAEVRAILARASDTRPVFTIGSHGIQGRSLPVGAQECVATVNTVITVGLWVAKRLRTKPATAPQF